MRAVTRRSPPRYAMRCLIRCRADEFADAAADASVTMPPHTPLMPPQPLPPPMPTLATPVPIVAPRCFATDAMLISAAGVGRHDVDFPMRST